jgi:hypothetical protein
MTWKEKFFGKFFKIRRSNFIKIYQVEVITGEYRKVYLF